MPESSQWRTPNAHTWREFSQTLLYFTGGIGSSIARSRGLWAMVVVVVGLRFSTLIKMVFYKWPLYHGTFCTKTVHDFDVKWHKFDTKMRWARRSFGTFPTLPSSEILRFQSWYYLNGDAMSNFRRQSLSELKMSPKASILEKAKTDHDRSARIASDPILSFPPNLRIQNLSQAGIMNP